MAHAESVSLAFLLTLERLSATERAIFILHDLFDTPFSEIASLLHKSEAACRQIAVRARLRVRESSARHKMPEVDSARLANAFLAANQTGDETALRTLLAADIVLNADRGGIRPASINLIHGAEKTARMLARLARKKFSRRRCFI